ncbi:MULTISPECIES: hypothetical protein [unclassified Pseudoxanthomonas]|uniref:hypothetical protein n=1 Tax=unclassified Pseudoxanthomonas TaxID=2645906 RepID=UPI00307E1DF5
MDSAPLFHATFANLVLGTTLRAVGRTTFYPEVVDLLEASRPAKRPSRAVCMFAAESPEAAYRFLMSQRSEENQSINVYQVEMGDYHKAPFRVIHEISKRMTASSPTTSLVDEYWSPSKNWTFWEFFGPEFDVVSKVSVDQVKVYAIGLRYGSDVDLSARI